MFIFGIDKNSDFRFGKSKNNGLGNVYIWVTRVNIEQKSVGIKHNLGANKVQLPHTDKSSQIVGKNTLGSSQIIPSSQSVLAPT